jgi:hypothetical protein
MNPTVPRAHVQGGGKPATALHPGPQLVTSEDGDKPLAAEVRGRSDVGVPAGAGTNFDVGPGDTVTSTPRMSPIGGERGGLVESSGDAVRLESGSKSYGRRSHVVHALQEVTLGFPYGSLTAVMGLSGSGKSTLLQCAAGLDRPSAGRIYLGGAEITGLSQKGLSVLRREQVGFVFQALNLVPTRRACHEPWWSSGWWCGVSRCRCSSRLPRSWPFAMSGPRQPSSPSCRPFGWSRWCGGPARGSALGP